VTTSPLSLSAPAAWAPPTSPPSSTAPGCVVVLPDGADARDVERALADERACAGAGWRVHVLRVPAVEAPPRISVHGARHADRVAALRRASEAAEDVARRLDDLDCDLVDVHGTAGEFLLELVDRLAQRGLRHRVFVPAAAGRPRRAEELLELGMGVFSADEVVVASAADVETLQRIRTPRWRLAVSTTGSAPPVPPAADSGADLAITVLVRPAPPGVPEEVWGSLERQSVAAAHLAVHCVSAHLTAEDVDRVRTPLVVLVDAGTALSPRFLERTAALHARHPGDGVAVVGAVADPAGAPTAVGRHLRLFGAPDTLAAQLTDGARHPWQAVDAAPVSLTTALLRRCVSDRPADLLDVALAARADLAVLHTRDVRSRRTARPSLADARMRQVRRGLAMLAFALRSDDAEVWNWLGAQPAAHTLASWTESRVGAGGLLDLWADGPLAPLREGRWRYGVLLHAVDGALNGDLRAHYALGVMVGMAQRRAAVGRRPLAVGLTAGDPGTADLAVALVGRADVRGVLCCADLGQAQEISTALEADLRQRGLDPDAADLEVRVTDQPVWAHRDVDLLLPGSAPSQWRAGDPVALWSLDPGQWMALLG